MCSMPKCRNEPTSKTIQTREGHRGTKMPDSLSTSADVIPVDNEQQQSTKDKSAGHINRTIRR